MVRRLLVLQIVAFFVVTLVMSLTLGARTAGAAAPPGPFFQGFEKDRDGWFDDTNGGFGTLTRRQSGYSNSGSYADGIRSSSGKWHARLDPNPPPCVPAPVSCFGPFTRWGGYTSTFPQGGYLTQVDIYLDVAWAASHPDTRFDWSSAINQSTEPPTHRRDFFFNAGTQSPADPNAGLIPGFWVNTGTNGFRGSSFPWNPCPNGPDPATLTCRLPVLITESGWYSFRHVFRAGSFATCPESTCLVVDFAILQGKTTTADWTLHSNQDPMSLVGGNRYGWFNMEEISDLAIDNSLRTNLCKHGHGEGQVHRAHFKFDKHTCKDDGQVEVTDTDAATNFQSTSISSATLSLEEDSQTLTIVGAGLSNGLPVAFTMIAVDNGLAAPAVFTLILTNGYTLTGLVDAGTILIE